jgi:transposase
LGQIRAWYRGAVAKGISDNKGRRTKIARDELRLARRFRDRQDMILRFATDLAVGFTSNQAERDVRPVKVQQRTSGGAWRTLEGLADFAVVQSYLSTAARWGIDALDALTQLFTAGPLATSRHPARLNKLAVPAEGGSGDEQPHLAPG